MGQDSSPAAGLQTRSPAENFLSPQALLQVPQTRKLPHLYFAGHPIFITFRLHGSLPPGRAFPKETTSGEAFLAMDTLLDHAQQGPLHLKFPEIASIVHASLHHCSRENYALHAWALMPNHVHILITPQTDVPAFIRRLKGFSARKANEFLNRVGQPFWQGESYDHLVRSPEEFRNIERYILNNPVKAGLVHRPGAYAWSSAGGSGDPPQV